MTQNKLKLNNHKAEIILFRIEFKVLLLVYKVLNGLAPKYIKEVLVPYKPRRHLRSEAKVLLDEPRTRLKFRDFAFSSSASRLCASTTPEGFYIVSGLEEVSQNTPL